MLRTEHGWWLWSAHTEGEALRRRLEDHLIADDVTVEDASPEWSHLSVIDAATLSRLGLGDAPTAGEWRPTPGGGIVFQARRGLPGIWELAWPNTTRAPEIPADTPVLNADALDRARLAAGEPAIPTEFGPQDLPQEAGLERDAISFQKGCYLGQEVMARLHAMGQVRRSLRRVEGDGEAPARGVEIRHGDKRRGEIRAAMAKASGAGWIGLAMVTLLGFSDEQETTLADGRPVRLVRDEEAGG